MGLGVGGWKPDGGRNDGSHQKWSWESPPLDCGPSPRAQLDPLPSPPGSQTPKSPCAPGALLLLVPVQLCWQPHCRQLPSSASHMGMERA